MEEGIILFDTEVSTTNGFKVVKVPEVLYQIFYDLAQQAGTVTWKQARIYKELCIWVDENYPGWGIQNFIDLSNDDVKKLKEQPIKGTARAIGSSGTGYISWGMYVLLQQGMPHIQRRTEVKQIDNGNSDTTNSIGSSENAKGISGSGNDEC